ncbi:MAG: hypothetical protein LBJ59_08645 [Zoogloeaceae bacterium]|jgi:hypothetical protein|nr:hypothetical protein [Zoogloeaceae bacterium]
MPSFEQEKEVKRYPKHFPGLRETLAPSVETRQIVAYRTVERFHPMGLRLDRFIPVHDGSDAFSGFIRNNTTFPSAISSPNDGALLFF